MRVREQDVVIPELEESTASYRMWTDREIAILNKYYGKASTRDIAKVLKRTSSAIQAKALELGLSFKEVNE